MQTFSEVLTNLQNLPMISNMISGGFFTDSVMSRLWSLIWFIVAYSVVFVIIPARILNLRLCDGDFMDNALRSLTISQVTIITIVYLLAFMKIYNTFTLMVSIIIVVLVFKKFQKKMSYRSVVKDGIYKLSDLLTGQLKLSLILRAFIQKRLIYASNAVKRFVSFYFDKNFFYHIICTVSLLVLSVRRCYFCLTSDSFPTSDISVHTSWINFLDAGYVFSDGIYPFGMHNIVSAFARLTFIDVVTVMRFWGPFNAILMCVVVMMFISRIFKSPAAYTVIAMVYCMSNFGSGAIIDRVFFSLPQEYGMLYIFPAAYFMIKVIEEQKFIDMVVFGMTASMTVSAHFYNAIFAVPLCVCVAVPYITKIFKKGIFRNLVAGVILAAVLCLAPMGIGRLMGYPWQGSLDWAVSMMNLDSGEEAPPEESQEEAPPEENQEEAPSQDENQENQENKTSKVKEFIDKSWNSYQWTAASYTSFWGKIVMICSAVSIAMGILAMIFKGTRMAGRVAVALGLNMFMFNYCLLHAGYFGLPSLIAGDRALNYLIYMGVIEIGVPIGVLWVFFEEKLRFFRWTASVAVVAAACMAIFFLGNIFESSAYYRLTYSAVTENYYKIKATHRNETWTIVSTVDELSLTRNKGWHYELWEFIYSLEQYEPTRVIQIPTEYVYFIIEKRPLKYNEPVYLGEKNISYPLISYSSARWLLSEQISSSNKKSDYYSDYDTRASIMSKAYYWADTYMSYFPDQMSIYYEDSDIIIYEIKQNMYSLNNFAIDYGYNTMKLEDWLKLHPEIREQMYGSETVSDSDLPAAAVEA